MPAVSKAQQGFMGVVDKVQKGQIPPSKVTKDIRQAAKKTSKSDVQDYLDTPTKDLPDRTTPEPRSTSKGNKKSGSKSEANSPTMAGPNRTGAPPMDHRQNHREGGMNDAPMPQQKPDFQEIVRKYNEYGQILKRESKVKELAQQLQDIAEYAEHALTNEMAEDWFDAHTIRRNVKEMKKYAQDFAKSATEADTHHSRLVAYYEDMGRILERYFEIADLDEDQGPSIGTSRAPRKFGSHFKSYSESVNKNAVRLAESKLSEANRKKFNSLTEDKKVKAAWRII